MLGQTFEDDPFVVYALPDADARAAPLAEVFAWNVRYGQTYGRALRTAGRLDGVVVLLPPSPDHFSDERLAATGYHRIASAMDTEEWPGVHRRNRQVLGHCEGAIHAVVPEDDWCLDVIGVDRDRRGQGLGGALIAAAHHAIDDESAGTYLLTFRRGNLPFYERNGYEVVVADVEPSSGLEFWGMRGHRSAGVIRARSNAARRASGEGCGGWAAGRGSPCRCGECAGSCDRVRRPWRRPARHGGGVRARRSCPAGAAAAASWRPPAPR